MRWLRTLWPIGVFAAAWLLQSLPSPNGPARLGLPTAAASTDLHAVAEALKQRLDTPTPRLRSDGMFLPLEPLRAVYAARQFRPFWVDTDGLTAAARDVVRLISEGEAKLTPVPRPASLVDFRQDHGASANSLAEMELRVNAALLRYARLLRAGQVSPAEVDNEYALTPPEFDPTATLLHADDPIGLSAHLDRLPPDDSTYRSLQAALATARGIAVRVPSWPRLGDGPSLRPGEDADSVPLIRKMLSAWGDNPGPVSPSRHYDAQLAAALKRFQARHGLEADGVVGSRTRAALNIPPSERVTQILLNMERWRWMPRQLGDPHVLVNMAAFDLKLVERGTPTLTMRVVVGQPVRRTPVFSDEITYLEFNPTWTVPRTILVEDLLPKIRRNPAMLEAQGIRVIGRGSDGAYSVDPAAIDWNAVGAGGFPYRLRQAPGPKNPLGRVKFMFPNDFSIYLHDTPKRELFARSQRAFSSGCIRVEKPLELAERLLSDLPGWDRSRIDSVIAQGKTRTVTLARPVPIHLIYLTAWLDGEGNLQFREDFYGRDSRLLQFLVKNNP
jgi:murein L,D-transpeptidase YcbB/YkuD